VAELLQKKSIRSITFKLAISIALPVVSLMAGERVSNSDFIHLQQQARDEVAAEVANQSSRLSSSDEEERIDAALRLSALRTHLAIPALTSALDDRDERVRAIAIDGLKSIGRPQVVPLIADRLDKDKSVFVKKAAAYALGHLGSTAGTGALVRALKDKDVEVRSATAVALSRYRDTASVPGLISALSDKSDFVRAHAVLALGVNGRAAGQAVPLLIERLDSDPSHNVKREAAIALGKIGDASALTSLERAKLSADPHLSRAASSAIELIKKR
jgi:HEAT repeat protein